MSNDNKEKSVWGIHTSDSGLFLHHDVVAIGWNELGDLSKIPQTRDAFKQAFSKVYPDQTKQAVATKAGMLFRFACEAKEGDYIVFPSKNPREIHIGQIAGDYFFDDSAAQYKHQRKVKWLKHLSRSQFSQGALYEAGSALTFFMIKNYADEYLAAEQNKKILKDTEDENDETIIATAESIEENTTDFILKELSRQCKGYPLEDFVADLLQAMGYRTTLSPHGGDRGKDIIAYKDELPPRILVQVKSQDGDIKESVLQALKGAMHEGDYGLFVTLSNYTQNAIKYLDEHPIIRGINGEELVGLILKCYDQLSEKSRKIIPLKKVYIPTVSNEDTSESLI